MADRHPTPLSVFEIVRLCFLLLFRPKRFIEVENANNAARFGYIGDSPVRQKHGAEIVREAFFKSLALVLLSSAVGYLAGRVMGNVGRCATAETVSWLQIAGASVLLWGTLFVRGWEIQTYAGVLFTERVNQWLYRALYCIGTAVLVYSLGFPACKP